MRGMEFRNAISIIQTSMAKTRRLRILTPVLICGYLGPCGTISRRLGPHGQGVERTTAMSERCGCAVGHTHRRAIPGYTSRHPTCQTALVAIPLATRLPAATSVGANVMSRRGPPE